MLRLLGTPQDSAAAEEAFARSAAWGASVEAIFVAKGVVLTSLATDGGGGSTAEAEVNGEAAALEKLQWGRAD